MAESGPVKVVELTLSESFRMLSACVMSTALRMSGDTSGHASSSRVVTVSTSTHLPKAIPYKRSSKTTWGRADYALRCHL